MVNQLEVKKSKFSLPVEVTIEEEALVIEEEVDHSEIGEDTKTGPMIMEIVLLVVISETNQEDASIVVKKDT